MTQEISHMILRRWPRKSVIFETTFSVPADEDEVQERIAATMRELKYSADETSTPPNLYYRRGSVETSIKSQKLHDWEAIFEIQLNEVTPTSTQVSVVLRLKMMRPSTLSKQVTHYWQTELEVFERFVSTEMADLSNLNKARENAEFVNNVLLGFTLVFVVAVGIVIYKMDIPNLTFLGCITTMVGFFIVGFGIPIFVMYLLHRMDYI
jgi:hypothetical protein